MKTTDKHQALRAVIIHGAHGGPDTNWFPWLDAALTAAGIEVVRPHFPTPRGQSLPAWLAVHDAAVGGRAPMPTVLVGHSLGAAMALRLVERADRPYRALFLAAGFVGPLGLPDYDRINASFFADPINWAAIAGNKGRACRCWAGDDDPYVPLARSRDVADRLGAPLDVIAGGGHLNAETGFDTFAQLRDAILGLQFSEAPV